MANARVFLASILVWPFACACGGETIDRAAALHAANAEDALDKKDYLRARAAAELALSYDPRNSRHRDLLARVNLTTLAAAPELVSIDRPAALEYEAEVMALRDPTRAVTYTVARGHIALVRRNPAEAEAFFRHALVMDGSYVPALSGLGRALAAAQKPADARAAFERALRIDSAHPAALVGLGGVLVGLGRYDEAAKIVARAIELRDCAAARLALASALVGLARVSEAGEHLKKATEFEPGNEDAHRQLGDWYFAMKRFAAARREYSTALELGAAPLATFGLAMVAERTGEALQAAALFDEASDASPELTVAIYQAGVAYESAGHAAEAMERYARFVKAADRNPAERVRTADARSRLARLEGAPSAAKRPSRAVSSHHPSNP